MVASFAQAQSLSVAKSARASGAENSTADLPLLFDSRERIAKPDLSALARLRFLTTVDFPPFNFIDQSGRLSGFHVDLVREICRDLEIEDKCQIQAVAYGDLLSALEGDQGEAVIAGLGITPELRQRFSFSRVYMPLPARFAGNRRLVGADTTLTTLASKAVGVVAGTSHDAMAHSFFPEMAIKPFETRQAMLDALKKGEVAGVFSDGMQLSFWTTGTEAAGCCVLMEGAYFSQRFLGEGLAILNRKADPALTQALNHALLNLSRSGRLNEIYTRYFPTGIY
ncbi:polar amino acid transport system substrate-binding protein [Pararhizobium capsulatum DSM 1112]|uniref:Polar amino acid transport system substrate-binding protein n=1 Tax=Pararhizobium capsulatum DSM 1112 TaxID=1121113 RepID=A0ABU0BKS8_9HYPH|nr:polar amino acid transport system substrate-binding protein [Pararhizobium capsulatum DSM 1112]